MAKEICISSTPHETRLAILEDDQLAEIYYERENEYTLAGSIYNGRVTRVLPGMQSAFVDIGLERDAFLYVTDFLELEDPEETDELEKAAATGGNTPPREVRHTAAVAERPAREDRGQRPGQGAEAKTEQTPDQKPEPRSDSRSSQDRQGRERRPVESSASEAAEPSFATLEAQFPPEPAVGSEDESAEAGARRWRGRRRRRGGRSAGNAPQTESTPAQTEYSVEEILEEDAEITPEIQASAASLGDFSGESGRAPVSVPAVTASASAPVPFVLPGESLSKYGGVPAADASPNAKAAAPVRPSSSFKPATLIESPLEWDGSGLLPGESLSKHRNRQPEAESVAQPAPEEKPEPQDAFSAEVFDVKTAAIESVFEEEVFIEESADYAEEAAPEPFVEAVPEALTSNLVSNESVDEELLEEELVAGEVIEAEPAAVAPETVAEQETAVEASVAEPEVAEAEIQQPEIVIEPEADTEASHNIDPSPSTGFRLFGLGGKKKKEEETAKAEPAGPEEEDFIEEEQFVAPKQARRGKAEANALQEFEDDAHPSRPRPGDAGSLMQEARIQLEEGGFDEDEDEEEPAGEGQPGSDAQNQQRRDRGGRGRRGKGGLPGQRPEFAMAAAVHHAVRRRPPICPSSATC